METGRSRLCWSCISGRLSATAFLWLAWFNVSPAWAQAPRAAPPQTVVQLEILTPSVGVGPLEAQRWRSILQQNGVEAQMHEPLAADKVGITEEQRGTLRTVKAVGRLNGDGTLTFSNRQFTPADGKALGVWLSELALYGAQGSPAGQPRYGLSSAQYAALLHQLSSPVTQSTLQVTFAEALRRIPLPEQLPLIFHESVSAERVELAAITFPEELQGLAAGSSLAFLLSQRNLAFRPIRTPAGDIQLIVEKREGLSSPWPVGGPAAENVSRDQLYPKLYEFVETGVTNTALPAVLDGVELRTNVRILIDRAACQARNINVDELAITLPSKRTSWALITKTAVGQARLDLQYQQDEAKTGFLLVTTSAPAAPPAAPPANNIPADVLRQLRER